MREKIKLSNEMLIGLLQGKEIHLLFGNLSSEHDEIIIAPPFDGTFLTHDQIREIQYSSEMNILNMLQRVYESKEETYVVDVEKINE